MKRFVYMFAFVAALFASCDSNTTDIDSGITTPELLSIIPKSGFAGNTAIVSGTNFSPVASENKVKIGAAEAKVIEATSTRLTITVPQNAVGSYTVSVEVGGVTVEGLTFTYAEQPQAPELALISVLPTQGYAGDEAVIRGTGFSTVASENKVTLGGVAATVTQATDEMLKIVIPENEDGTYEFNVTVGGDSAGELFFTYLHRPTLAIYSISPARGYSGDEITLTGEMFSPSIDGNKVTVGGIEAQVTAASDSVLKFLAPQNTFGVYPVEVTVDGQTVGGVEFVYLFGKYTVETWLGAKGRDTGKVLPDGAPDVVQFNIVHGLCISPDKKYLWINDRGNNAVRRTDLSTEITTTIAKSGQDGVTFNAPWRGSFNSKGDYYFANKGAKNVVKITPDLKVSLAITGLQDPMDVQFDKDDNMYIVDRGSTNGIVKYAAPGYTEKSTFASFEKAPLTAAFDKEGNLIVCLTGNCVVLSIAPDGTQTVIAGSGAKGGSDGTEGEPLTATFGDMWGVTVDDLGNIYITDGTNHTIRRISPDENGGYTRATVASVIGTTGKGGYTDGIGNDALINTPYDVHITKDGKTMYIADFSNFVVRRVKVE